MRGEIIHRRGEEEVGDVVEVDVDNWNEVWLGERTVVSAYYSSQPSLSQWMQTQDRARVTWELRTQHAVAHRKEKDFHLELLKLRVGECSSWTEISRNDWTR